MAGAIAVSATSTLVAGGEPAADIGGAFVVLFLVWNIGRRLRIRSQYLALLPGARGAQQAGARGRSPSSTGHGAHPYRTRVARRRRPSGKRDDGASRRRQDHCCRRSRAGLHAMTAVELAGRQALGELRHLLGVLRPEADVDGLGPQPGQGGGFRVVAHLPIGDERGEAFVSPSSTIRHWCAAGFAMVLDHQDDVEVVAEAEPGARRSRRHGPIARP